MVSPELIAAANGLAPQRILVTGGSGFVGSHLAIALQEGGHDVIACGRNSYRVPFKQSGPSFQRADLANHERILELCADRDLVYHVGAYAAPSGNRKTFNDANVVGTKNIIDGCAMGGVSRLVYVSSTAIQFDFKDATKVTETDPVAEPFACEYARSKATAESIVKLAADAGLNAVILRARAVFGPGDNSLLPRLLKAAAKGRLRRIGKEDVRIDLTYIDNLILALIQAATTGEAGSTFTITNDEPVELWSFIESLLRETGHDPKLETVSKRVALIAAKVAEKWHALRNTEPEMTPYTVGLLSTTKTFDISAAKRELHYQPSVDMQTGVQRTIRSLSQTHENHSSTSITLKLFTTGYTEAKSKYVVRGGGRAKTLRFHALVALLKHPQYGYTLFDTGYSPRFFDATERWPYRLYRTTTPVGTCSELSIAEQLKSEGIYPAEIKRIVLSHFHADHICGLLDFPHADILASARCWKDVRGKTGLRAFRSAFLPSLIPSDISERLFLIDHFHSPGFGPFQRGHDLFADGSVRLFDLSGHAPGQLGVMVQRGESDRVLLAADAVWTSRSIRENLKPTLPFRLIANSVSEVLTTQQRLHDLHCQFPDVEIIPTHCPEVAFKYGFDEIANSFLVAGGDQ